MLQPKRTKFRKQQKGRNRGLATSGNRVSFGEYGLRATARGRVTARQGITDCRGDFRTRRAICEDIRGAGPFQGFAEESPAASCNQGSRQVSGKWIGDDP